MSECPFIIPRERIVSECCKPVIYKSSDGEDYQFWQHTSPDGDTYTVQHCSVIGRKRDVFECFNEDEWKACRVYRSRQEEQPNEEA